MWTATAAGGAGSTSAPAGAGNSALTSGKKTAAADTKGSLPPEGSLLVYENGKEVFRALPTVDQSGGIGASSASGAGTPGVPDGNQVGIIEVTAEQAEGSLLHRVEPDYPDEARQQKIQGEVVLDVRIDQDGAVQDLKLVTGPTLLAQAAADAVKQWRFKPKLVNGRPVQMQTRIRLNFRLPRE